MLGEEELAELAADIRARGLLQPIVLDAEGRVLDGRNRFAACELAGIEPRFETYEGDDPDGYALAVNGQRREMNKGQKAVVGASMLISSLDSKLKDQDVARALGVSKALLSQAIRIAGYKDLAALVLAGIRPFSTALEEADDRDRLAAEDRAAKDRLRVGGADLLALVDEERMSLDDAVALLDAREEKARQQEDEREREEREREQIELERRQRHTRSFGESLVALWSFLDPDPSTFIEKTWLPDANPHRSTPSARDAFTDKGLALLSDRLRVLAEHARESGGTL
jgi:ParB-like chromosome segregation protein Spo0J